MESCSQDSREAWDRLTLVLLGEPQPGAESLYREACRRELERLTALSSPEEPGDE